MEYVLRFLLCLLKWTLIVVVVAMLCTGAFTFGMNYANISVLVTDGMKMHTGVVLGYNDAAELPKFFTEEYLAGDKTLNDRTYKDFTINSFDAQVDIEKLHTLPWEDTATATVTETATIDGELPIDKQTPEQLKDPNKIRPPEWRGGVYDLKLEKRDSGWIIVSVVRTGDVPEAADAASTAQEGAAA